MKTHTTCRCHCHVTGEMQFALMQEFGRNNIISAYEVALIEKYTKKYTKSPTMVKVIERDMYSVEATADNTRIVYGKFLSQDWLREDPSIPGTIESHCNTGLYCYLKDRISTDTDAKAISIAYLAYGAIQLYERDKLGNIPFAALVYGEPNAVEVIDDYDNNNRFAIECTYRRPTEEILLNLFNRIGIFAIGHVLKFPETDGKPVLENWIEYVRDRDVRSVAKTIY